MVHFGPQKWSKRKKILNKWGGVGQWKKCYFTWLKPMIIAAPEVKPEITGWAKKLTKNPKFKSPPTILIIPTIKEHVKTYSWYLKKKICNMTNAGIPV